MALIYAIGGNGLVIWAVMLSPTVEAYDTGVGIRVTDNFALNRAWCQLAAKLSPFQAAAFPVDAVVTIDGNPLIDLTVKVTDSLISGLYPTRNSP